MNPFCLFNRRMKSSVICVFIYIAVINVVCLIYLSRTPSPWISHHGPFFLANLRRTGFTCKPVQFSPSPLPLTALASYPGSGNTWLRHLVQQATGIATGSIYNDVILRNQGFPGEGVKDGRVILIKTHEWGQEHRKQFSRAVMLLRDPFDSLLAEFNRRNGGHRGQALPHDFKKAWQEYVSFHSRNWAEMYLDWLKFDGPLHVIHFKDLEDNTLNATRTLFQFLGVNLSDTELSCMVANSQGNFRRRKTAIQRNSSIHFVQSMEIYSKNVTRVLEKFYKSRKSSS